jgi:ankyrin repeat protein
MGHTALILATISGHLDVVKFLVEAGADKEHEDKVRDDCLLSSVPLYAFATDVCALLCHAGWAYGTDARGFMWSPGGGEVPGADRSGN